MPQSLLFLEGDDVNIQSRIEASPVLDITTRLDPLATDEVRQQGFAGAIRTKQTPVLSTRDFEMLDLEYGTATDAAESLLDDEKRNHDGFDFNSLHADVATA